MEDVQNSHHILRPPRPLYLQMLLISALTFSQACFTAVYGPVPGAGRTTAVLRKSNLGVCGVCRRPMKVGDGDNGKSNSMPVIFFGNFRCMFCSHVA